ncbi:nucleotide sugar dehydrogenase [Natrinema salaciae]|uniref:UDP-N-acetyl-D-mannosamine dehydrogenase n=1 Tax=Natrinema salaciae TaxID=1186196 RepID=A0A1H9GWW6_9EURY|nr:nucleotide sugar dehydrogenase [Natrinema salaciae]SEQ54524.1 UDP-N-acetyl-D-galactosamine dehydrogenase [Natrinema salaciae]
MTTIISDTENRADERESDQHPRDASGNGTALEHTDARSTRSATICVVGLGYVGLPLAVGFAQSNYRVIGYDVDDVTVGRLQEGIDTTGDLSDEAVRDDDISYTTDATEIGGADYVVIAVPTPIDDDDRPDLGYIESAATTVGSKMDPGTTVVLESTVYPGATREVLVPALEDASGLTAGEDFFVGYSPERATPGDENHGLEDVVKVVSAQNEKVLEDVATLYESIVDAGVHRAPSIEVAEACKVIENIQRDVNIALVNELSMAFERLGIDTREVLDAAGTKWNFHDYRPGLVGGHCIPIDPYFFAHRATRAGADPELIRTSRAVNESMPNHVAELTIKALNQCHKTLRESRVLVLGLAYKADVGDIRSSKVADVVDHLREFGIDVAGYDPHAEADAVRNAFDIDVQDSLTFDGFDAVLLTTGHSAFEEFDLDDVAAALDDDAALVDVVGAFESDDADDADLVYRSL